MTLLQNSQLSLPANRSIRTLLKKNFRQNREEYQHIDGHPHGLVLIHIHEEREVEMIDICAGMASRELASCPRMCNRTCIKLDLSQLLRELVN